MQVLWTALESELNICYLQSTFDTNTTWAKACKSANVVLGSDAKKMITAKLIM